MVGRLKNLCKVCEKRRTPTIVCNRCFDRVQILKIRIQTKMKNEGEEE